MGKPLEDLFLLLHLSVLLVYLLLQICNIRFKTHILGRNYFVLLI